VTHARRRLACFARRLAQRVSWSRQGADLIVETALGGGTLGVMRTWWPAQQPSLMSLLRPDSVELLHLIHTYD